MTVFKLSQTFGIQRISILLLSITVAACGSKTADYQSAEPASADSYGQAASTEAVDTATDTTPQVEQARPSAHPHSLQSPAPTSESVASDPIFTEPITQDSHRDSGNPRSNGAAFDPLSDWDVSSQPPAVERSPKNAFEVVCKGGGDSGWETSDALLAAVGTEDCAIASKRLSQITNLQASTSEGNSPSPNSLTVDLPVSVDLDIIASAMPNLTKLNLTGRVIEDLSPVAKLTQLNELHISHTQTKDISPISGLVQLKRLDISYNQVDTIAPIQALTQLKSIDISHNPIADIGPLAVMYAPPRALEMIDLSNIQLDYTTCPPQLGDACEDPRIGYEEGLRSQPN
ncbi:MAG: leucine-rich repeat domain-containing protein [Cyanobacteria bacterium J06623_5]